MGATRGAARSWIGRALGAACLALAACGITDPEFSEDGVVRFLDVEGGCWVIDTGGDRLEPTNLGEEFRFDGLPVRIRAEERTDLMSVCQVGRIVELTSIRVRDS